MIICGTGHRPDKLGGYGDEVFNKLVSVAREYFTAEGYIKKVISGGALGWDQAIAQAAIDLNIPLALALPFPDFDSRWPEKSRAFLGQLSGQAEEVHFVCEAGYAPWKMQQRNEWMVDNAEGVVALWNGTNGGTGNCIKYATKVGKPIINLWESYNARL